MSELAKYVFIGWQDGPTTPSRTITVTADVSLVALYARVVHNVVVSSTPIAVTVTIGGQQVPSGSPVQVDEGAQIVVSVPSEVTA